MLVIRLVYKYQKMKTDPYPNISSFVIRFVLDHSIENNSQPIYRGSIRHVQTDIEIGFIHWEDAVTFMQRYVPINIELPADIEPEEE